MSELLQEYVDSGSQRLRVDREAGVIRGVKLLGLASRNGRRYREEALSAAASLYEGAKVNINHPKGHPLSPRDYQDRLGVVRGVHFRAGDGLFVPYGIKHGQINLGDGPVRQVFAIGPRLRPYEDITEISIDYREFEPLGG